MLRKFTILRNYCSKVTQFQILPPETKVRQRSLVESIAETRDQQSFIAWHPRKQFPYEFTRPLPTENQQLSESLLKDEMIEKAAILHKHSYPEKVKHQLAAMTFTTKHRWYPRRRDLKKKKTPMDRPYL